VTDDLSWWRPLSRAQFRELRRDQRLRERRGKTWTVHVAPHERGDGLARVVLRAGDHVRQVDERFANDYGLVEETDSGNQLRLTG
jgi:ketosteroid isomerase-like protein